jgi:hypothetical protein
MTRWTLVAATAVLVGAGLWHLPATAQHAATAAADSGHTTGAAAAERVTVARPQPAAPQLITFDEYRDFRLRIIAERQAELAQALAAPGVGAAERADLEGRKAYYDRLAAMPAEARDRLFRLRFDEIDTNHDGLIDEAERAAWRIRQREHYRQVAAARLASRSAQPSSNPEPPVAGSALAQGQP